MIPFQIIWFLIAFSFSNILSCTFLMKVRIPNKRTKVIKTTTIKMKPNKFWSGLKLLNPAEENSYSLAYCSTVLFEEKLSIYFSISQLFISADGKISNSAIFLSALMYISSSAGKSTLNSGRYDTIWMAIKRLISRWLPAFKNKAAITIIILRVFYC